MKVVSGKLGRDKSKVEEGKKLMHGHWPVGVIFRSLALPSEAAFLPPSAKSPPFS